MASRYLEMRRELRPMLRLAAPLALAELGWMAMGVVDTIMAGRLGPAAIGAGTLGTMVYWPIVICGTGMLLGMDTLVSQSHGANDARDCRRTLINGVWLGVGLTPPLIAILLPLIPLLRTAGTNSRVMDLFVPYMDALLWGTLPLMLYAAFRRYLQSVGVVRPIMFALVSANIVNAIGNWVLMFGHWGFPAMGLTGSGWATSIARLYMAAVVFGAILWRERKARYPLFNMPWRPELARIRRLAALGLPAAMQILFEGALFGLVTVLAARLDEVSLAAHGIAVQVIATAFMVPLGISSGAAVRTGQAMGRRDPRGAETAGWTALLLSAVFMGSAALVMTIAPRGMVRLFSADPAVVAMGAVLLRIAAWFELFDGFQVVATGALRGLGDTRSAMLAHLTGYWVIGLPISYTLCFSFGWGARGIWTGLTVALILIGIALVAAWRRRMLTVSCAAP